MDRFAEVAELICGEGAYEIISKLSPAKKDRRTRAATAGLSAVGGAAGTAGLAYGASDIRTAIKAGEKVKFRTKAFVPLELAGLGGELMSTKILHNDVKRNKPVTVAKAEPCSSDLHVPSVGRFKRVAAKKAYQKGKPVAEKVYDKTKQQLSKSVDVTWEGEISKLDADKQQVFGWASIVEINGEPVVDLQGDYIDIDEIEKSAYNYVIKSRKGGDMHRRNDDDTPVHSSDMIESFLVTPEKKEKMGLPDSMPTGWWVGYQINDPQAWELVKSGKRTGFSIHGRGQRTATEI